MWQQYLYLDTRGRHSYFVYTPKSVAVASPVPLIVMLHGCTQTAEDFARGTAMNLLAEQHGFLVLYPQQTSSSNYRRCWNWFLPAHQQRGSGEPARIVGMIKSLRQQSVPWTIDPARIYVAGLSSGASMAVILGATYPDLFAAIGVHSGLAYQAATNVNRAFEVMARGGSDPVVTGRAAYLAMGTFSRVVPSVVFQGTGDTTVVPINADHLVQQWMQTNRLVSPEECHLDFAHPAHIVTGQVANGHPYAVTTWDGDGQEPMQSYWKIGGMGHAWSGGDRTGSHADPRGPDASMAMYTFFMAHPMQRAERQKIIAQRMRLHRRPAG